MIIYRVTYNHSGEMCARYAKNKKDATKIRTWLRKQQKEDIVTYNMADDYISEYLGIDMIGDAERMDLGYGKDHVVHWLNNYCEVIG